jgi:hypothetical protein
MRKAITAFALLFIVHFAYGQFSFTYNGKEYHVLKASKFKDSTGKQYNYNEAMLAMMGGEYEILPADARDASRGFLLSGISKEEQLKRAMAALSQTPNNWTVFSKQLVCFCCSKIVNCGFSTTLSTKRLTSI